MTELNWKQIDKYRKMGLSWEHIASELKISCGVLCARRKLKGLPMAEQYKSNNGKRQCSYCGHRVKRKLLKLMQTKKHQGMVCPLCYERLQKVK